MGRRGNGEGTIVKREIQWTLKDGTVKTKIVWEGQLFLGNDPVSGKAIRKCVSGTTRKEVSEKIKSMFTEQAKGRLVADSKIIFSEYIDRWLQLKKNSVKKTTYDAYEILVTKRIKPALGALKMSQISTANLNTYLNRLADEKLGTASIRKIFIIVSNALSLAESEGILGYNPAKRCQVPKTTIAKTIEFFTDEEIKAILGTAKEFGVNKDGSRSKHHNFNMYPSLLLAIYSGCRRGEILGLRWNCVNFAKKTITVKETLLQNRTGIFFDTPKSATSNNRVISLPDNVMNALQAHKWFTEFALSKAREDNDLVFCNHDGCQMYPRNYDRAYRTILKTAGIKKDAGFHSLRHSSASLLVQQGINISVIQSRLGHADVRTTQIYSHVHKAADIAAADALQNLLQE